jgi:hypothetical protein
MPGRSPQPDDPAGIGQIGLCLLVVVERPAAMMPLPLDWMQLSTELNSIFAGVARPPELQL